MQVEAIVCDDIRQEQSGKYILVGVYTGVIIPAAMPVTLPLAIFLRLPLLTEGSHGVKFDFGTQNQVAVQGDLELQVGNPALGTYLALGPFSVSISEPGFLKLGVEIDGESCEVFPETYINAPPVPLGPPTISH